MPGPDIWGPPTGGGGWQDWFKQKAGGGRPPIQVGGGGGGQVGSGGGFDWKGMLGSIPWGDLLGAGISAGGTLVGGDRANRARADEAAKDRAFQERMRNTSFQAAVTDMEAAGLNPALAYSQGGAAQPGGAIAGVEDSISPAVSSAQHARRLQKELKLLTTQEIDIYESARLKKATTKETSRKAELVLDQQRSVELSNQLLKMAMPAAANRRDVETSKVGRNAAFAERIRRILWGSGPAIPRIGGGR